MVGITLEILEAALFTPVQPGLLDRAQAAEPLPDLCARLQDVLGTDAVCVPAPVDTWRPEAAWIAVPWGEAPPRLAPTPALPDPAAPHEPPDPERPRPAVLLAEPTPLRVAAAPSGRPRALLLERAWTPLDPVEGPERLGGEWWRSEGWGRDYWRVGLPDGRRAWIYREALLGDADPLAQRWFLHGWLDGTSPSAEAPVPVPPDDASPSEGRRPRRPVRPPPPRYAELVCRSNYSFCEGASFPEELIERAKELGLAALALTN
ncbi:MAG: hypothetical protein ACK4YP_28890, partial [Myxococcota bacterium]